MIQASWRSRNGNCAMIPNGSLDCCLDTKVTAEPSSAVHGRHSRKWTMLVMFAGVAVILWRAVYYEEAPSLVWLMADQVNCAAAALTNVAAAQGATRKSCWTECQE